MAPGGIIAVMAGAQPVWIGSDDVDGLDGKRRGQVLVVRFVQFFHHPLPAMESEAKAGSPQ